MPYLLTCPSSRGIGFALTRRLLRATTLPVVATARSDTAGVRAALLAGLDGVDAGRLDVLRVDVTDEETIAAAAKHCKDKFAGTHLHLAFTLPGILRAERSPAQIDAAAALDTYRTNVLGPLLLLKHLSPLLPRRSTALPDPSTLQKLPPHATYALMSARVGSIADNALGGWYSYRSSKAAVNSLAKTLHLHLRQQAGPDRAIAVALHPGTVRTGLSKEYWGGVAEGKLLDADRAAEALLDVVSHLRPEQGGRCWDWKGEEIPP
ncbi:MAG: hypothetical protein M1832_002455 [Thelocarpon impressellum]|nr:MAG: hypothetical protein M1832_002455 [Thelocarpon impressellum]